MKAISYNTRAISEDLQESYNEKEMDQEREEQRENECQSSLTKII